MAVPAARQPEQLREPVHHRQLELRRRGRGEPRHPVHVQGRDQKLGEDAWLGARVRDPRKEPRVVPVRQRRQHELVEIAQHRLERLRLLRRRLGQRRPQLAGCDPRGDRQLADPAEVVLDPGGRTCEILAEGGQRFFFNFSICFHVRVFSTSSFVSHARRACPTPSSTNSSAPTSCPSESITSFSPASRAARAFTSVRSSLSGCELISRNVPVSSAFSITRSTSTGAGGRFPIFRFVRCPMQSTYGLSIAARTRSVASCSNRECTDATTQSRVASSSSETSSVPSGRTLTSIPFKMRNGATTSFSASICSAWRWSRSPRRRCEWSQIA